MIINTDDYLSAHDAAEYLGISPSAVNYRCLKGQLERIYIGRTVLITKASLGLDIGQGGYREASA